MYFSVPHAIKDTDLPLSCKNEPTMKIDPKRKVHNVSGENIVISQVEGTVDMTKVVALNESAMLLYNELKSKDFTTDDIVQVLLDNYDIDEATARRDAEEWVVSMREQGLIID